MADTGKLTDTELLGLINQTAGALQKQSTEESPRKEDDDSMIMKTTSSSVEHPTLQEVYMTPEMAETFKQSNSQADDFNDTLSQPCSKFQSDFKTSSTSTAVPNTDLAVPVQILTGSHTNNTSLLPTETQSSSSSLLQSSSSSSTVNSLANSKIKSDTKVSSISNINSESPSTLHCDMPSTFKSQSSTSYSQSTISISQSTISNSQSTNSSSSSTTSILQSTTSNPKSSTSNTQCKTNTEVEQTLNEKPQVQCDTEQISNKSQDELFRLVHEYRCEVEATKKKWEKCERQLTKANDYNEVLRKMVEKLSGEIHRMKNQQTCSVHVQVDKDDFLDYTTGMNTMPRWNAEDEQIKECMDTNESSSIPMTTPEMPSTQQPVSETDNMSIADSIKQAAEAVVQQQQADMLEDRGYVYDEHSGLYYHSASGYYYDQHKSLFYDPKSGIYYYYDYDNGEYLFHSQIELPTQLTEQSGYGKSDQPKKKVTDGKKSRKTPRKKKDNKMHSTDGRVFKNRKERRQAEKENKLRDKRKHKEDMNSVRRERKRKYRDTDHQSGRSDDRGQRSDNRGHRSERSHHRGHRSGEREVERSEKRSSRSRSERKHGKRRYDKEYIELHSDDTDVQLIEGDPVKTSKGEKRARHEKSLSREPSDMNAQDEDVIKSSDLNVAEEDSNLCINDKIETQTSEEESDIDSETDFIVIDNADEIINVDAEESISDDDMKKSSGFLSATDDKGKSDKEDNSYNRKNERTRKHHDRSERCRTRSSERNRNYSSNSNDTSGDEAESGELTDSDIEQSSESYSSYYSDTDEEEEIYEDMEQREDQGEQEEMAGSYPPCIRVMVVESDILPVGTLYIVTCVGAKVGRENCDICIADVNVSKVHAEIIYNESASQYEIFDHASQNGTFLNNQRLSPAKIASECFMLSHDDTVMISSTKLLCHIHPGYDTCDQCEPGVVIATHKAQQPQNEIKVLTKEEKLRQKKQELNQIKKRYGLKNSAYEDNSEVFNNPNYTDKAEERRKKVGSDIPGHKQEAPASVHRPISTGNVGHKMLQKMGWKEGDSLGKNNKGIQEPISVTLRASQKAGLGSSSAGAFSADDANTVDMKKASRRIQAQQRFKQIEGNNDQTVTDKHWTQGDTEFS